MYSKIVAMLLLGASVTMAQENSLLEDSFKNGSHSGHIGWYGQQKDPKNASKEGFSGGSASVNFETAPLRGATLGLGVWGSLKTSEKNDGDYKTAITDKSIIHNAFIKVEHEGMGKVIAGRQEVDFEWMSDFIEGATVEIGAIENLVLSMAWAKKQATVGFDEITEFVNVNTNDGLYMVDAKYTPNKWLELNPYYYHANNIMTAPGIKTTLFLEISEDIKTATMLGYTKANSDDTNTENGYVARIEQGIELFGANLTVGYIKVDKKGAGGLGTFGDQMPLEEGNKILETDARTPYASVEYEIEGVKLGAKYAQTKYLDAGVALKEKEFDFNIGYEFYKNLEASLVYANIENDADTDSYNIIKALVSYKF
ncbi:MAG: Opr family porin [Sulfurospirillaceae bacterium]|nr:Opr family porin [Sulfurospirillaceae bacterium]MDD3462612.1 Opr family porin [Sulfurospirillaceae bacterium]